MFLCISMPEEDRKYHRFVYSRLGSSKLEHFQAVGHIFGSTGSPCIAVSVIKLCAIEMRDKYPDAADVILRSSLIDDNLGSHQTKDGLDRIVCGLEAIAARAGMKMHKWCSNAADLLPGAQRAQVKITDKTSAAQPKSPFSPSQSSLGMVWDPAPGRVQAQVQQEGHPALDQAQDTSALHVCPNHLQRSLA